MVGLIIVALKKPYTFVVLGIVILLFGVLAIVSTPKDIFPNIGIPVVAVVWTYNEMSPNDMSGRIVYFYERTLTTQVNGIQRIESNSLWNYGVVMIYFHPNVDINAALAQVTAASQTVLKLLPAGVTPPYVLEFNASSVPIIQIALSSNTVSEMKLQDLAQNFIRPMLSSVNGAAIPSPYGGFVRQVQIDIDPHKMEANHVSAQEVGNALAAQNQITPVGTIKTGKFEYVVQLNDAPTQIAELNNLPVKRVNGTVIYMHDIAWVHDGWPPQINAVRVNGRHAVLLSIEKVGSASTLDIIAGIKALLPHVRDTLPPGIDIEAVGDQSMFVKDAVIGVVREAAIAGVLTALMILLFLGSWRSTLIIATSIPLCILASIVTFSAFGETVNVMTLGGLALAVGMLVDEATVTIENINYHLEQGKDIERAVIDGARQIVVPAFVSLLAICIVFVPMFMLTGIAHYLFVPLALAVVFAMVASFLLSRTLVLTMARFMLSAEGGHEAGREGPEHGRHHKPPTRNPLVLFQQGFERRFEALRGRYQGVLRLALTYPKRFILMFLGVVVVSFGLAPFLGQNFFPSVDGGQIKLHVRAQIGTRIEESERLGNQVENVLRQVIPPKELVSVVQNIGLPISGINMAYNNSGTIGVEDSDVLITLAEEHRPTADYVSVLRDRLPRMFPSATFSFLPADITTQILNFGLPSPIDIKVIGQRLGENQTYINELLQRVQKITGIADARIQQSFKQPTLFVDVDRTLADQVGLTEYDVTNSLQNMLAGSFQTAPTFWLNPRNGVSYPIVVQSQQYDIDSTVKLDNLPITGAGGASNLLGAIATMRMGGAPAVYSHYNVAPVFDIYASVSGRDLGAVAADVRKAMAETAHDVPRGTLVQLVGQVDTMTSAFNQLFFGLGFSVVLIYLLIVVNFQSWLDPFVIITALPAALAGIVWMLFVTGTTLSVPALTGAIMCMGVATANSILVVSFAREQMALGHDSFSAALQAGFTRFRPVMMTALAMVMGMIPTAISTEQNAPLGRAVIGGLLFATVSTFFFVPTVFSLVHRRAKAHATDPQLAAHAPPAT
ncbi:MAG: efflux RND transporter permease subunit [Rhodospirillales bacterium]|nr:efflux RND transporter permease subunit [Rhodospirillales bacterium]